MCLRFKLKRVSPKCVVRVEYIKLAMRRTQTVKINVALAACKQGPELKFILD